jgi:hypothetical protein
VRAGVPSRVAGHLGALGLGALVAVAATAVHRLGILGVPVGLGLAVAASLATAWRLRLGDAPRQAATYCLGWVTVVGLAVLGRPEGDAAVAGDLDGYVLMGTGFVLAALGVASLAAPDRPTASP